MKEIIDGILMALLAMTLILGTGMVWLGIGLGNWLMMIVGLADFGLVVGCVFVLKARKNI